MVRVIVEDLVHNKTTIFPNAYSVDVVDTPNNDILVVAYSEYNVNKIVSYPMRHVYRYTVVPITDDENEEKADKNIKIKEPDNTESQTA